MCDNNEILMTSVIYYALFGKKMLDDSLILSCLTTNAFGIFTTIRRSNTISVWPQNIHGCLGYWEDNFRALLQKDLYAELLRVSHDAIYADDRRNSFGPIQTDSNTYVEADFMMRPIYVIDPITGVLRNNRSQIYSNDIYGVIIQTKDGNKKATYLPNVFPHMSWPKILASVQSKANIGEKEEFTVYAYKVKQVKARLNSLFTNRVFSDISITRFMRFLTDTMNPAYKYPIVYSCSKDGLKWEDDDVRNISVMSDVLKYNVLYPNILRKKDVLIIENKIWDMLQNMDHYSSQALSFLGHIYSKYSSSPNKQKVRGVFCNKLLQDWPNADAEFAKPQIMIGLRDANCDIKLPPLTCKPSDSIFKLNWTIQAVRPIPLNWIEILKNKITNTVLKNVKAVETNILAVAFESICCVLATTHTQQTSYPPLISILFELFYELEQRKKETCPVLYAFLDQTARVDITGHVQNGLYSLHSSIQ